MLKLKNKNSGFTLIELLVVATIIIVLATIGVVSYRNASINSRNSKRKADLEVVRQAAVMYRSEKGEYPKVDPASYKENFAALVQALYDGGYLTENNITDPKTKENYMYIVNSSILRADLETSGGSSEDHDIRLP
jgi:prepilin-type N-terminal cleavage/methylation domain-containing protein